jgi:hypothetical protein
MKYLIYLCLLNVCLGCSTGKKMTSAKTADEQTLPELPLSEMDIPVRIAAAPILAKAEQLVPTEFTSDSWPEFMHPSCDFRYKYRFARTNLQISAVNNVIGIQFGGNYQVSGSKCLCTAGIPVTPWISGSCGFLPQPLRKVVMSIHTGLQFLPNYQVRTTTTINSIQPVDKCEVSVFSSDITQLVMDSIRSSLLSFSAAMDQTISGLSFTKLITQLKDSIYHKIPVGPYGYFLISPTAFRIGQLNYSKDSFSISLGISCKPSLGSDPENHVQVPSMLPALLQTENRNGIHLYMDLKYDYDFITKILHDSLYNKVFELTGRTIVVKDVSLKGISNHQIELRIDFTGSNHGSIYLRGTPTLDTSKQTLSLPDIQYSMAGEDLALKIGRSLFRNKIRRTIQGKSYLDITAWMNANKTLIDQTLNRELIKNLYCRGQLKEAKIIGMLTTPQNIHFQVFISGELKILGGNL